jgi:hypothetical protein
MRVLDLDFYALAGRHWKEGVVGGATIEGPKQHEQIDEKSPFSGPCFQMILIACFSTFVSVKHTHFNNANNLIKSIAMS